MPKITLPTNKKWNVNYDGEYYGDVIRSFNTSFSTKYGSITTGDRIYNHTVCSATNSVTPTKFLFSNANGGQLQYWCTAGRFYYRDQAHITSTAFTQGSFASDPTSGVTDMITYGKDATTGYDRLVANVGTNLYMYNYHVSADWNTTWWTVTLGQTAFKSFAGFCTFGIGPTLFILDQNMLHSISSPDASSATDVNYARLVVGTMYTGNWIVATRERIYLGFKDKNGDDFSSIIVEYDPFTETTRTIDYLSSATTGFIYNNVLHVIDRNGKISYYNGTTFTKLCELPPAGVQGRKITLPHRNGICQMEEKFLLALTNLSYEFEGGLYEYDPNLVYIYHVGAPTDDNASAVTSYGYPVVTMGAVSAFMETMVSSTKNTIMCGADTTAQMGIFTNFYRTGIANSDTLHRGWLVTGKIPTAEIDAVWRNILVKYNPRRYPNGTQTGGIVVKYRTMDNTNDSSSFLNGTWVNATTFSVSGIASSMVVGAEVTVRMGAGSGTVAHITVVDTVLNRITLDDTGLTSPSGAFRYTVENWTKITTTPITTTTKMSELIDIGGASEKESISEWIQFKIDLRGQFLIDEIQCGYQPSTTCEL